MGRSLRPEPAEVMSPTSASKLAAVTATAAVAFSGLLPVGLVAAVHADATPRSHHVVCANPQGGSAK